MEIAFVTKAKQGYIYRYMMERKMSASALAKEIGITPTMMGRVINFQWLPKRSRHPRKNSMIDRLERYFHLPIDYLFPPELTEEIAEKLQKKHIRMVEDIEFLPLSHANAVPSIAYTADVSDGIPQLLSTLEVFEEKVLRLRYGIGER